jgi:hypothetical protein
VKKDEAKVRAGTLGGQAGTGKAKRRGGKTRAEVSAYMRSLVALREAKREAKRK